MQPYEIALLILSIVLVLFLLFAFLYLCVLPRVIVHKTRTAPNPNGEMTYPDNFDELKAKVKIERDLVYPSKKPSNRYNLYLPLQGEGAKKFPLIVWIHGGGFIGGTKDGGDNVMIALAAAGHAVASIDYAVAPEHPYPTAVRQASEFAEHILKAAQNYPEIDTERIAFGGDSAGAQIAAQYIATQTNVALAAEMGIPQTLKGRIKAAVLVCGPFDLPAIRTYAKRTNKAFCRLVDIWGRAYFRKLLWTRSRPAKQTVICSHLTDAFPPTFLTDGNKGSFEVQNRKLAKALKERGIPVEELYFDPEQGDVPHEYLFHLHEANSQLCMSRIGTFLDKYLN